MSAEHTSIAPDVSPDGAAALELYARAVVATRHAYRRLALEDPPVSELEKVAEQVTKSAKNPALSVVLALAPAARDDAARAVQAAFVVSRVARGAADHERALVTLALAALLVDAGRARLASASHIDLEVFDKLPDALDLLSPAATATLGVTGARSPLREAASITAFEAAWLERPRLGPLYGGALGPRLAARLVCAARALLSCIAPKSGDAELSPFEALHNLATRPGADVSALALLSNTLGPIPVGTVVELPTGAWAVVGPEAAPDPRRPVLWELVDPRGRASEPGRELALPEAGIVRPIAARKAHFNPAFPLVAGAGRPAK